MQEARAGSEDRVEQALLRIDPLWLAVPLGIVAFLHFGRPYLPNPDAYYHVKCGALYLEQGWVTAFPWLPFTVLSDFPNAYIALHYALAPFHLLFPPERAIPAASACFAAATLLSVYAILRRHRVAHPGLWVAVLALGSQILCAYLGVLKGGALFFLVLPWFLHFLLVGSVRGVFALSFLAVYAYVGAFLLPALAVLYVAAQGGHRDPALRRLALASAAAFVIAMAVHPQGSTYWQHAWRELMSSAYRPAFLVPAVHLGAEWRALTPWEVVAHATAAFFGWLLLVAGRLRQGLPPARDLAVAAIPAALFGYALLSGPKFVHLFALSSLVLLPILAQRWRPFSRRWLALLALLAVANAALVTRDTLRGRAPVPPPAVFASLSRVIEANSAPDEVVLAPWSAFPGLWYHNDRNRYVAGMNTLFLMHASEERFRAYLALYAGRAPSPETLLPRHFEDARLVLVRAGLPGAGALVTQLRANEHFDEIPTRRPAWKLFRLSR